MFAVAHIQMHLSVCDAGSGHGADLLLDLTQFRDRVARRIITLDALRHAIGGNIGEGVGTDDAGNNKRHTFSSVEVCAQKNGRSTVPRLSLPHY